MHDWLSLVANAARAEKPDHIRLNAVRAVQMAAPSVVIIAHSRRTTDDGWNVLALRSGFITNCISVGGNAITSVCRSVGLSVCPFVSTLVFGTD